MIVIHEDIEKSALFLIKTKKTCSRQWFLIELCVEVAYQLLEQYQQIIEESKMMKYKERVKKIEKMIMENKTF